jgi:hypothetical protein
MQIGGIGKQRGKNGKNNNELELDLIEENKGIDGEKINEESSERDLENSH